MRKDTTTTPSADPSKLDTIKPAEPQTVSQLEIMPQVDSETRAGTDTTSGRPAQKTSPGDLQSIEAQESRKEGKKRRKDNTSAAAHIRYMSKSYDRMELQLIKGDKERLRAAAAKLDISPTALIIRAVNAYTDAEILTEKAKNPYI